MNKDLKKICFYCGEEFFGVLNQKYCSRKCLILKNKEKYKLKHPQTQKNKKCKYCKNNFIVTSSTPTKIYCSKECCKKAYKEKYRKLMNGIIPFDKNSSCNYYRLRFEIFKRDNFTCKYCGRNVKDDGIKLHCDHIIPKKYGGKLVANNLITSCMECNLGKGDILLSEHNIKKIKI